MVSPIIPLLPSHHHLFNFLSVMISFDTLWQQLTVRSPDNGPMTARQWPDNGPTKARWGWTKDLRLVTFAGVKIGKNGECPDNTLINLWFKPCGKYVAERENKQLKIQDYGSDILWQRHKPNRHAEQERRLRHRAVRRFEEDVAGTPIWKSSVPIRDDRCGGFVVMPKIVTNSFFYAGKLANVKYISYLCTRFVFFIKGRDNFYRKNRGSNGLHVKTT